MKNLSVFLAFVLALFLSSGEVFAKGGGGGGHGGGGHASFGGHSSFSSSSGFRSTAFVVSRPVSVAPRPTFTAPAVPRTATPTVNSSNSFSSKAIAAGTVSAYGAHTVASTPAHASTTTTTTTSKPSSTPVNLPSFNKPVVSSAPIKKTTTTTTTTTTVYHGNPVPLYGSSSYTSLKERCRQGRESDDYCHRMGYWSPHYHDSGLGAGHVVGSALHSAPAQASQPGVVVINNSGVPISVSAPNVAPAQPYPSVAINPPVTFIRDCSDWVCD